MSSWRWDRTASVHAFSEVSPAGRRSFRHVQTQLLTSRTQMLFAFPERMSNYARTHQATKSQVQIYHRRRNVLACIWRREADLMFLSLLAEYICIVLTLLLQIPYNIYIYIQGYLYCVFVLLISVYIAGTRNGHWKSASSFNVWGSTLSPGSQESLKRHWFYTLLRPPASERGQSCEDETQVGTNDVLFHSRKSVRMDQSGVMTKSAWNEAFLESPFEWCLEHERAGGPWVVRLLARSSDINF